MTDPADPRRHPPGLPATLDYPDVPVGALVAGSARRFGDRTAFHYQGRDLSFARLYERAGRFAAALRARGIGRGDVVALHLPNCLQYPVAYYGVLLAGATFSPTNPLLPAEDLAFQLADSGAAAVVTFGGAAAVLAGVVDRTAVRLVALTDRAQSLDEAHRVDPDAFGGRGADFEAMLAAAEPTPPPVHLDPAADLAHLGYTGGTTGRSKGVEVPHRNVVANVVQYAAWGGSLARPDGAGGLVLERVGSAAEWPVEPGAGVLVNLTPWFHVMGTVGYLNLPVLAGTTVVIHDRFDPARYLADAERFRVTNLGGAPPLYAALVRHPDFASRDLSSVRHVSSGAAPLPVELIEALRRRFPDAVVGEGYGLTEVTMGAVNNPSWRSGVRKPGSVGLPLFDTAVRIVEPGTDRPLPAGETGEVCLRGPQVMRGYHNRPAETAAALRDGWLHTGDLGYLDADGYLFVVDRIKDMLLYKGYNVYPRELEELLYRHPSVAAAAVVGRPDRAAGELPVGFVVARAGATLDVDEVMTWLNAQVTPYKRVRELHVVDALPVSAAGKTLKRELRRRLGGCSAEGSEGSPA